MSKKFKNKDLAARLGVSGTLVSLVLNNKGDQHGISKATQEKVLMAAKQMGYFNTIYENNSTSPAEETPGVIGMIVSSMSDHFICGITPYLHDALTGIGFGFSLITRDPDDIRFDRLIAAFKKFFSGMILVGDAADDSTIRALRNADYPFVVLDSNNMHGRINSVNTDFNAGADLIADHISKMGYKNIVIITGKQSEKVNTNRIEILEDAILKLPGIKKPVIRELEKVNSADEYNFNNIETLLRPPFRAEIFITVSSSMVYPLLRFLERKKQRIPQDLALISAEEGIGFDLLNPPVTCLRKPLASMAMKTTNMIWTEIKNGGKSKYKRQVNTTPELVIRTSCGTI
ncbi:MAG TPA: LacI family DNA-binding transcriptional regulator [Bacteroidales bacterium]|nr:LacI family DNA-binding transcriptional regulator [Bacteroidales bacterium]HPJ58615.1 LacI family DNA-binding transcriptional regulator [Bacteroidales bacterium]HPR11226.1 LacI family DNA-binding transcriptional regulator [Bacteroidales bacterium]HRW85490.1 LacI family DNA-binding transcriptional regulator [Bacteroidales bacterium]